jgi:hypothetical protein
VGKREVLPVPQSPALPAQGDLFQGQGWGEILSTGVLLPCFIVQFHRIEIVWLGTKDQTEEVADQLHKAYYHVFEDVLELEWRAANVTPWFMAQEGKTGLSDSH